MRKRVKISLWIGSAVLLLIVCMVGFFLYDQEVGFGAPAHPSFTGYTPTVLPDSIKITGQTLTREHQAGLDIWTFNYQVQLSHYDLRLSEGLKDSNAPTPISCEGYGGICAIKYTAAGLPYRVWYSEYKGKPFGLVISWFKGNTSGDISVSDLVTAKYINYSWSSVLDSLQPVNLAHLPVIKRTVNGSGG